MKTEESAYDEMYNQMNSELQVIADENEDCCRQAERSIIVVRQYLVSLKAHILSQEFFTVDQEVYFFKKIKPRFYCLLIYHHKILQLELKFPAGRRKEKIKFLHAEQTKLVHFFNKYGYLYEYQRSGSTFLDNRFFTRGNTEALSFIDFYGVDTDPLFTTGYDYLFAKMEANELISKHLNEKLSAIQLYQQQDPTSTFTKPLFWTASKAALIELLYGLQSTGVLNNGKVALNDIAVFLEQVFRIKLGNYYRVFQEIRIRKKSRTQFLDEMKERLVQKMDYADENPHVS